VHQLAAVQEAGSVKGSTKVSVTGVSEAEPPEVDTVWPLSEQVAFQLTVAMPLTVARAATVTEVGAVIACVSVQVAAAPDPLQKPATFAWAAEEVAVSVPAVSRPVTTA
jgi:hypothetical protein